MKFESKGLINLEIDGKIYDYKLFKSLESLNRTKSQRKSAKELNISHTVFNRRLLKAEEKLPQDNDTISLSINYSGQVFESNLTETEISGIAETTLNNIESDLNEYGDAITVQERIALLLRLIRKELEQL